MKAADILRAALQKLEERGKAHDAPGEERSVPRTVELFKQRSGRSLSVENGYVFLACMKQARLETAEDRAAVLDTAVDLVAYEALALEARLKAEGVAA